MTDAQATASTLRAIRTKLNLTQKQLAERLGVSFATVNRWEGGANMPQRAARETITALAAEAGLASSNGTTSEVAAASVTRRRRDAGEAQSTTKPMEQMLWDAACSIRGEKDAPRFKDYLLPLLFLKRLSDVFDDEIARLSEDYGDRGTALEIAEGDHSLLRFYLPPEARWGAISGREAIEWPLDEKGQSTKPRDIGEHLTKAVRAVVKQNPMLSGVIDVVDFAAERNGERDINPAKLRLVVETFSDPRYRLGLADVQPDFLGRAYEYLLRKFAEGSGQSAGEFFTPTEVGFLMAHIMRPRPGEDCHDYACGSAGLLVKLQLVARELDPTAKVPLKLTGQELQAESYAVAQMNGIIHDMEIEIVRGDTMINPKFRTNLGKVRGHDIVVANPMWNQPFAPDVFANDPFDRFRTTGGVTTGKGDWAWLQHTLACLNDHSRAAVVLDSGAVTRGSGSKNEDKERNIRKWFVDHDLIDGVILLPDNLFYNTSAAGVIVVLNKRKPASRKDKIVLLNASKRLKKGKPKNYIPEDAIRPLAAAYLKGEAVEGEIAVITRQEAEEADYNLSPSRWAGDSEAEELSSIASMVGELERLNSLDIQTTSRLMVLLRPVARGRQMAEWTTETIEDCLSRLSLGRLTKLQTREYKPTGRYPIIDQGQSFIAGRTDDDSGLISSNLPVVIFGDHTRALKFVDFPFVRGADGTQVLRPRDGIDPLFFYYACKSIDLPPRGYNRHFTVLKEKLIPIPPPSEQLDIASVLRLVDESLKIQTDEILAMESLKRTSMRELFTRGLHNEAQKETEIGLAPISWDVDLLGAHHTVGSGGTPSRNNNTYWSEGTIPWVKTTEVNYGVILETEEYITPEGLRNSAAKVLPFGTLLMAMYGQGVTRAKVAILGIEAACNQACATITSKDGRIDTQYLFHFLTYRYEDIRRLAHGGQQQNLNLDIVRALIVSAPSSSDEQHEIVEILDAVNLKIDLHKRKRAVLEDLLAALLHKLMTGEIRVADLNLSALGKASLEGVAA